MPILENLAYHIDQDTVVRMCGYGGSRPAPKRFLAAVEHMAGRCTELARPRAAFEVYDFALDGAGAHAGGGTFTGNILRTVLAGAGSLGLFVTTIGSDVDNEVLRLSREGDMLSSMVLDAVAGVVLAVSSLDFLERVRETVARPDGDELTPVFSPGECRWDIREQSVLFSLVDTEPIGVFLNNAYMMVPKKSRSGLFGIGPPEDISSLTACDVCDRRDECSGHELMQILAHA